MGLFRRKQTPRAPSSDPDIENFYRGVEAAEAGPPRHEEGADLNASDVESLQRWMSDQFDAGQYDAVWSRRVALGYSLAQEDAPAETWFWVNALPALAALRTGERHHPLVATAAGFADQAHRSLKGQSDAVDSVMSEINERFFG
jgi:hypothetical protein